MYKYFGSVDGLIAEVIRTRLAFPAIDELLFGVNPDGDEGAAMALVSSRVSDAFEIRPETMNLIGWSLGNTDQLAVGVIVELRQFCETLAEKVTGGNSAASWFFGQIVSVLCDRQILAAKEGRGR